MIAGRLVQISAFDNERTIDLVDNMSRRGYDPLTYYFEDQAPGSGEVTKVAEGCYWAPFANGWTAQSYQCLAAERS